MKANQPITCNYVTNVPTVTLCGKPAIGTIYQSGYCKEHAAKAQAMFGKMKMIVREEIFNEAEFRK